MAQEQGSDDALKEFYLQQIMAYVDVRLIRAHENALEAIENYLKLDDSNAKVLACLGVVCVENHDNKGAIEHFQKSLELNKRDHEVGIALLRTLFGMKDYEGMMSQIEHYGVLLVGSWLRNSDSFIKHKEIMHAARTVNKVDIVIKCYEHEIQNIQLSDEDLREVKDADPVKTAQKTLLYRTRRVAISSMFRVYLGWLYLEILGQPDEAFELWKTAFFQHSEFFNKGSLATEFIPDFFALFSQLIYEKALDPDPEVAGRMIFHLEHLHRREKVFQEFHKSPIGTGLGNVNLLLARLYLKHGRKDEARKMLNDQFQSAIDILGDEIGCYDKFGYDALAALLFLNGQLEKAEVASSLKRFFENGFDVEPKKRKDDALEHGQQPPPDKQDDSVSTVSDNDDDDTWLKTVVCAGGYTCENESRGIPYGATAYTCTTCANVNFCETCYDSLRKETGQRKLFVCSPSHDFIKTPPEGLEKIKDQKITMNGKSMSFVDWLAEVRKEWKTGLCFKS
ncbi:hypothetical protein DL95DRAFT_471949 [Leptodontidium sp. 2 PMI_412]|nr:hypothetical protein DL95DRAFT_471949 [Leptodontidium sp. 2 PMI_412]